jgi:hypothetical protein
MTRFLKALIALFISSLATGIAFRARHKVNEDMRNVTKHMWLVGFLSHAFTLSFTFMYLVNWGVLMYSFLGCPCIRYWLFRERPSDEETPKWRFIQIMLGPCCATFWQVAVWLTLCIQLAVSYAYLVGSMLLWAVGSACRGGDAVIKALHHFMHKLKGEDLADVAASNLSKWCEATHGIDDAAMQCFWGCLLSVVSQVLMIMIVSEEKGRIEGTMAEGVQTDPGLISTLNEKRKRRKAKANRRGDGSDSDSSSSGSSSSGASSRAKTRPLMPISSSNPSGGRNYKLPGGPTR